MAFDPPWVTVLPSREAVARFLADPAERAAAGGVELRVDLWGAPPSYGELANVPGPKIITWRRGDLKEADRLRFLRDLLAGKAGDLWLDFDAEDPAVLRGISLTVPRPAGVKILLSRHLTRSLSDAALRGACRDLLRPGVDAAKLVLADGGAAGTSQALRIAAEFAGPPRPLLLFCAGIAGTASRFLAIATGQRWGYGRLRGGPAVVPGQPAVADIATRYGGGVRPGSPLFAVIGRNVSRSLSPGFHHRLLLGAGRPERWLDLSLEDPDTLRAPGLPGAMAIAGLAVTSPWKGWARKQGRAGAPGEERHPAWNTLRIDDRGVAGWNTDAPALIERLEARAIDPAAPTLILGAGGAAQPIALELAHRGAQVWILRRGGGPLPPALAEACVVEVEPAAIAEARVLINATGAGGTAADRLPWPIESFRGELAVEYRTDPRDTDFLRRATAAGAAAIDGVELFAAQARRQAEIFYGIAIDAEEAMRFAESAHAEISRDRGPPP
jgi:shikimate dehydrogenase